MPAHFSRMLVICVLLLSQINPGETVGAAQLKSLPPDLLPQYVGQGLSVTQAVPSLQDAIAVAAGQSHTCVLTTGGGVKCWGRNWTGQLGDGTTTDRSTPVDVVGLDSNVATLASGNDHTCALTTAGGVKCWGGNWGGQLGDGTTTQRSTPTSVFGLASGVISLAAGFYHTCAVTADGGAYCWGTNNDGQLGDGTTIHRTTPVGVSGLASGVIALAAGDSHTCALTSGGGAQCWGDNWHGQLGDGTTVQRRTPVDVSGLVSGATALAAGASHTCALTVGGEVKCWGENVLGQLGDGTTNISRTPVDVIGLTTGVIAVTVGSSHSCALTTSGGVKCWGANWNGQLGDGTTSNRSTPVDVSGLTSGVSAVAAGRRHTCALTTGGGVKCWGDDRSGQLGDGATNPHSTPLDVIGLAHGATVLTAGGNHTCVLTNQHPKCWGEDGDGQLGLGTITQRLTPVDVVASASHIWLNYADGQRGSFFTLTGENFPASAQATVTVNGSVLTNSLLVNAMGQFIVFLSTTDADIGYYMVQVSSQGASAVAAFVLVDQSPLRFQDGGGVTFAVPAGSAVIPKMRYLPLLP